MDGGGEAKPPLISLYFYSSMLKEEKQILFLYRLCFDLVQPPQCEGENNKSDQLRGTDTAKDERAVAAEGFEEEPVSRRDSDEGYKPASR